MKVAQINCSANGSTGNIVKAIHRKLLKMGHQSYIFYACGHAGEANMYRIGNYFSRGVHAVLSRNLGRQGYFSIIPTWDLIRKLERIQPDIIHLHNLHGCYLNLPMLFGYLKRSNAKIVLTLHDCWLFTGKCPHFTVVGCEKWKESCGDCPQLWIYPKSKVDTTAKCLADKKKWLSGFGDRMHIVAVSHWLCDMAKQSYLNQYPIHMIYNGINTEVFHPMDGNGIGEKYGIRDDQFVILGVASVWDDQKGLSEFFDLSKEIGDSDIIVLVGLSSKQILNLPPHIIGIRRTENQKELAQLYSRANVFVNPSKEETFGLVTAEAMACGTPVIVYDSTACAEVADASCVVLRVDGAEKMIDGIRKIKEQKQSKTELQTVFKEESMVHGYISEYSTMNEQI